MMNRIKHPKVVALVPMKANSERVKNKNFKNFCGKPLFQWIINSLLEIDIIEKIVINTDAKSTLLNYKVLNSNRIEIRDRDKSICGDYISMNEIIRDDLENVYADYYLMTHTTNPLLSSSTINKAIELYNQSLNKGFDSLFTVNKVQTRFYDKNCFPVNHNPKQLLPTQELEPFYEENSNLYIFSKASFEESNGRIGKNPKMLVTSGNESIDIDTMAEWEQAEALAFYYKKVESK